MLAIDPGDVRKKKRNLTYAGEVVVTWHARTNGDVLSKLRVSNKEN